MTAIIGYADGTNVWIGGDSAGWNGHYTRFSLRGRKVFRVGEALIGGSGSHRTMQVIEHCLKLPPRAFEESDASYLVAQFIPALKLCLKEAEAPLLDGDNYTTLMLGYRSSLYIVGNDYCLTCPEPQARAIGSGGDFALGAFLAYRSVTTEMEIETAMLSALRIAGSQDATVGSPYYVEKL